MVVHQCWRDRIEAIGLNRVEAIVAVGVRYRLTTLCAGKVHDCSANGCSIRVCNAAADKTVRSRRSLVETGGDVAYGWSDGAVGCGEECFVLQIPVPVHQVVDRRRTGSKEGRSRAIRTDKVEHSGRIVAACNLESQRGVCRNRGIP